MIRLDEIEAKAKAAMECNEFDSTTYRTNFHVAMNPQTALALIRVARAAQLAAKYAEAGDVPTHLLEALKEIEA